MANGRQDVGKDFEEWFGGLFGLFDMLIVDFERGSFIPSRVLLKYMKSERKKGMSGQ